MQNLLSSSTNKSKASPNSSSTITSQKKKSKTIKKTIPQEETLLQVPRPEVDFLSDLRDSIQNHSENGEATNRISTETPLTL